MSSYPFARHLLAWYDQQGRKNLPWRHFISPYRVWVSEIMLQQTQVKTVIPYFNHFMQRFPDVFELAKASEDEVLHLWTGLGYYSRARYLQQTAKQICTHYNGKFPDNLSELQDLPGIGRSTAGAILAIAFEKNATILEGNVKRIFSRFRLISNKNLLSQTQFIKTLWDIAQQYTPKERIGDYTQAIMDLGAMVCVRNKPLCALCPISLGCLAFLQQRQAEFPSPKVAKKNPVRAIKVLIFYDSQHQQVLLEKRPPVGIWSGLWSFPECIATENIQTWCDEQLHITIQSMQPWPSFKHAFTHFTLDITPIYIDQYQLHNNIMDSQRYIWYKLKQAVVPLGFSTPIKRLLAQLCLGDV